MGRPDNLRHMRMLLSLNERSSAPFPRETVQEVQPSIPNGTPVRDFGPGILLPYHISLACTGISTSTRAHLTTPILAKDIQKIGGEDAAK